MCPCARGACAWRMARAAGASAKACENFPTPRLIYHFRTQKPFLVCCHWRDHFKRSLKGDRSERSLRGKKTVLGPEMVYKAGSWKVFARFRACAPRHAPRHFLFLFFFTRTHTHAHTPQMSTSTTSTSSSTGTSSSSSSSFDAWQERFQSAVSSLPPVAREQWQARSPSLSAARFAEIAAGGHCSSAESTLFTAERERRAASLPAHYREMDHPLRAGMGPPNPSTPLFDQQFAGLSVIESRLHVVETANARLAAENARLVGENGRLRCTLSMYQYMPSYVPSSPPYSPTEPSYAPSSPPFTPPHQIRRRDDPSTPHPRLINLVSDDDETVPPTPDQVIPPSPDDDEVDNGELDTEADGPTALRRSKRARRE